MSGIEVVGVVLGAIPLIIVALEASQSLIRKRDMIMKRGEHVKKLKRALKCQYSLLRNEVDILLARVEPENATAERWKMLLRDPAIEKALREYLKHDFEVYLDTVTDCEDLLLEILKNISNVAETSWVVQSTLGLTINAHPHIWSADHSFWKGARFVMRKNELDTAITELEKQSVILERLQRQRHKLSGLQHVAAAKKSQGVVKRLGEGRIRAQRLYEALATSWRWDAQCHDSHAARLYLEPQNLVLQRSKARPKHTRTTTGNFSLCLESLSADGQSDFRCCAVQFASEEENEQCSQVQFVGTPLPAQALRLEDVRNLCKILWSSSSAKKHLLLEVPSSSSLQYALSSQVLALRRPPEFNGELVLLSEVMSSLTPISSVRTAATIAASAFLLHDTHWLGHLDRESFAVLEDCSGKPDLDHLLVEYRFDRTGHPGNGDLQEWQEWLLSLGIVILEVSHQQTVEEFCSQRPGLHYDGSWDSRVKAAKAWLLHAEEEDKVLFPDVLHAVRSCIEEGTCDSRIYIENSEASARIVENVIQPLWNLTVGTMST